MRRLSNVWQSRRQAKEQDNISHQYLNQKQYEQKSNKTSHPAARRPMGKSVSDGAAHRGRHRRRIGAGHLRGRHAVADADADAGVCRQPGRRTGADRVRHLPACHRLPRRFRALQCQRGLLLVEFAPRGQLRRRPLPLRPFGRVRLEQLRPLLRVHGASSPPINLPCPRGHDAIESI